MSITSFGSPNTTKIYGENSSGGEEQIKVTNGATLMTDLNEASIIDDTTTAGTTYFCYAPPGTASSAASWKVYKIVDSTGVKTWADGNANYDNVADNRASLTYS